MVSVLAPFCSEVPSLNSAEDIIFIALKWLDKNKKEAENSLFKNHERSTFSFRLFFNYFKIDNKIGTPLSLLCRPEEGM